VKYSTKILFLLFLWLSTLLLGAEEINKTRSLEEAVDQTDDPKVKMNLYIELVAELKNNNPDKALDYARLADEIAEKENNREIKLMAMTRMAEIYWAMTDHKTSMELAMKAKDLAQQLDNKTELAEAHRVIGRIYTDLGDYKQSSEHFFESLRISEKTGDKSNFAKALNSIGYLYFEQQNYDKALQYYAQSLAIGREINDPIGISRGLNNVAAIYAERKQADTAEKYILEAVKINIRIGQRLWEGINYLNLGEINQDQKNYEVALSYHNKCAAIFGELNNMVMLSASYINLSDYYDETGDTEQSLRFAEKAFAIGQANGLKKTVKNAAEKLHAIYLKSDDLKNAYKYGMIQYQMKDSLGLEESMTKLSKLELQYNFEKQGQEEKLVQQRKDFITIIIIISLSLVVILVLLLMSRQKMKARNDRMAKQKLQDEIDFKNKELTLNVMNLIRKNEILSDISNRLMLIENEAVKDETKDAIIRIAHDLQKNTEDEIWEEFELRFKQVHGEFYERLMQKFPDLSPNDLKLCAFLRLNITSKEICKMTGQRLSSLEIARHRLRKKLGISNTQTNLVTFLAQI
jgi:tetratricopeptide (TPR) repeat protein